MLTNNTRTFMCACMCNACVMHVGRYMWGDYVGGWAGCLKSVTLRCLNLYLTPPLIMTKCKGLLCLVGGRGRLITQSDITKVGVVSQALLAVGETCEP